MAEDYYDRLGVASDASTAEIEQAYRDRLKETHPDVNDDESASEHTKRVIEAKEVLTDDTERKRYDRLGHDAYVGSEPTTADSSGTAGADVTETSGQTGRSANGTATGSDRADHTNERTAEATGSTVGSAATTASAGGSTRTNSAAGTATEQTAGTGTTSWYNSTPSSSQNNGNGDGTYRAWDTDRSYAVNDSPGMFDPKSLFASQRTVVLLGTTFVIYPVLLFGALYPTFPLAANIIVALCTVLVISFLQSVPQVGIAVFGIWTVLLPIILVTTGGVSLVSLYGFLAMCAVIFPLGLSILTWIAIRPTTT